MEQNREPRNKSTCMWSTNFWPKSHNRESTASSINGAGKTEHEKHEHEKQEKE